MNKLLALLLAGIGGLLSAAPPSLEIYEFEKSTPVISAKLSGKPQEFAGTGWTCMVRKNTGKIAGWNLRFTSPKHDPVRLAVKFTSPLDFKAAHFWDGQKEWKVEKLPLERREFLETFPMATAENGKSGHAVGFAPQTTLSCFSRALTPAGLVLETRIVVDDRRVQELDIVDYDFDPEFGWCNAVEDYQKAYLPWFVPTPGVDHRIYGVGGYLLGAHVSRPFILHSSRSTGLEWEWTYAPWLESGNWYPVGEGWKNDKNEYWDYYGHHRGKPVTREEYHDAVKKEMFYGNKIAAMFYYILVKDIHQNVANKYPETVQGGSGLHSLPSNRGKTKSAFAPGSPLFDYLKKQLRNVVDHYEVSGFSFDMANSSYHFATPSQLEYAVGRSWYDDGRIFTSDTVAPIPFSDYIHTLKRNGKTMGTIFNAALSDFSAFTMFHCDGGIMEGSPESNLNMVLPLRLSMGRKPMSFWHGGGAYNPIRQSLITGDPERKARTALGRNQFYLHKCYEFGFTPMNWRTVSPFFKSHLPVLRAVSEAGYHPVSAVKGAEPFRIGRFGEGAGTILTFGNPKRAKITRSVRVVNRYLGKDKYGFLPQTGSLKQRFLNGETEFELTLEPKQVIALQTVALRGVNSEFTASANGEQIVFQADTPFEFTLPAKDFLGRRVCAGSKFYSGKADKSVKLSRLPACGMFESLSSMTAFLDDEKMPVIEAGSGADTQIAAKMVAMYRPHVTASRLYCGKINTHEPGFMNAKYAKPDLAVREPGKTPTGQLKICIGTPADFPQLKKPDGWSGPFIAMPDPNTLWIGGGDPAEVRKAAYVYFSLLDRKRLVSEKVDFKRLSGWGVPGKDILSAPDGKKYLRITNGPHNGWRYIWYSLRGCQGGDEVAFSSSVNTEKVTAGRIRIGVFEFTDKAATRSLPFRSVEVKTAPRWQTVSGRIKLNPKTQCARFYFLCSNLAGGDEFLVRSLEWTNLSKITEK